MFQTRNAYSFNAKQNVLHIVFVCYLHSLEVQKNDNVQDKMDSATLFFRQIKLISIPISFSNSSFFTRSTDILLNFMFCFCFSRSNKNNTTRFKLLQIHVIWDA